MIAFQNVSFGYNRRRKVFADLSLTFGEGHIHGLLGRNGAGKTTLLRMIANRFGNLSADCSNPIQGTLPSMDSPRGSGAWIFCPG